MGGMPPLGDERERLAEGGIPSAIAILEAVRECPEAPERAKPAPRVPRSGKRGGGVKGGAKRRYLDTAKEHLPSPKKVKVLRLRERLRSQRKAHLKIQLCDALEAIGQSRAAKTVWICGKWYTVLESDCGTQRLQPVRCDHPLCAECAAERAKPLRKRVQGLCQRKGKRYRFLTLTVKNMMDLDHGVVAKLIQDFSRLRETDVWKERVSGGVYSIETTYGSGTYWHPHLHVIFETHEWIPDEWIFSIQVEWKQITGDSFVVNMRAVDRRGINELIKYTAKASTFVCSPELVREYLAAFHRVRRVQCFGSFFGKGVEEKPVAEIQAEERNGWKCKCGMCTADKWSYKRNVHWSQTILLPSGERQLHLFEDDVGPPNEWKTEEEFQRGQEMGVVYPSLFPSPQKVLSEVA